MSMRTLGAVAGLLVGLRGAAVAQPATPADSQAAPAARPAAAVARAGWLSDRLPLRVGDLLTIIVDEEAAATERVSTVATADRSLRARLGVGVDSALRIGPAKDFSTGVDNSSRDIGESGRRGALSAVLTVRVSSIDPLGIATVEGVKNVTVDGRVQEVRLKGLVRAEDVSPANVVASSRVADAIITYKGKKIGPRAGILGKILSILWP